MKQLCSKQETSVTTYRHHTPVYRPFVRDYPGEPVSER